MTHLIPSAHRTLEHQPRPSDPEVSTIVFPCSSNRKPQTHFEYFVLLIFPEPWLSFNLSTGVSQLRSSRPSFGQASGHGLPQNPRNIYEDVHATIGSAKRHPSNKQNNRETAGKPPQIMGPQPSFHINQPPNPQLHRSLTMSSADVEFDPMFNELMRLDATEWFVSLVSLIYH